MDTRLTAEAGQANAAFGRLVIETLWRSGVAHFVISPGSRSTPLAVAASATGALTVIPDERSASFYALGRIKASGRPAAFICTSGSAVAHAFPAVIEAAESGLPLLVLSADRPPELQHCHAGQTIDQLKLFGSYARFFAQLPVPQVDERLARQTREILRRAVAAAMGQPGGPAHLNCPFREPFFSRGPWELPAGLLEGMTPLTSESRSEVAVPVLPAKTLLLAGPRARREDSREWSALVRFLQRSGMPVLADGCNPLRHATDTGLNIMAHYDRLARNDALWDGLEPEAVLVWGEPPTSKILRERLQALDLNLYPLGSGRTDMNPLHGRLMPPVDVHALSENCPIGPGAFGEEWAAKEASMESALARHLAQEAAFFEGAVHRILAEEVEAGTPVVFANSLAVRDAEWFLPAGRTGWEPYSQRGANGIDGTVSLARGIVEARERPGILVIGDLAFLHDSNGLLQAARTASGLLILLINNSGGGIFEFLPAAHEVAGFEALFATPQTVQFADLAKAHGIPHSCVADAESLRVALRQWRRSGLTLLEVRVDRKISAAAHRASLSRLAQGHLEHNMETEHER